MNQFSDINKYAENIVPILEEIGRELFKHYGNAEVILRKNESPANVVTELDHRAENFIRERLHTLYPSISFVGEEFGGDKSKERFWMLDPIDGTAHFIRGIPFCTTMLGLIQDGEVVFSAIHDFVRKNTYTAEKGGGAKMDGKEIHVSKRRLSDAYMAFESNLDIEKNRELFLKLRKRCILFNTINCGFEYILVASGKTEGRVSLNPFGEEWDYAPGSLLVSEAGGIVRNLKSKSYDYRNFNHTATNPLIYNELVKEFGDWF